MEAGQQRVQLIGNRIGGDQQQQSGQEGPIAPLLAPTGRIADEPRPNARYRPLIPRLHVLPGRSALFSGGRAGPLGAIIAVVGAARIGAQQIVGFPDLGRVVWPIVLVLLGLWLVIRARGRGAYS